MLVNVSGLVLLRKWGKNQHNVIYNANDSISDGG